MVRSVLCLVVFTQWSCTWAADDHSRGLEIKTGWKFSPGDDPNWSKPTFDDSDWESIEVGKPWEALGHADHDGYGWYRYHVRPSARDRQELESNTYGSMRLLLGKIDDVDQTWFNGKLIGRTGRVADPYRSKWDDQRVYQVPADSVRWNENNVIAVRVFDGDGDGGMVEGPYSLRAASLQDVVSVTLDQGRGDGILLDSAETPISAVVANTSSLEIQGVVTWVIKTDEREQRFTESSSVELPAQGEQRLACSFSPSLPGFYRVNCVIEGKIGTDKSHGGKVAVSRILGFRPEEVETELTREEDFDQFWQRTRQELAVVQPEFKVSPRPERDSATHEVFEVSMRSLGGVRVRGWYEKPKVEGTYPALLRVPGYTEAMQPTGSADPFVFLSFNIRGHGNSQEDVSGQPADYWLRDLDDKEKYFYRGAYCDCLRAVDFLASRGEVDAKRIGVTGGSQGGGLSLVTAAFDQRISLCAPDIPFLCNWERYFKTTSWPEMDAWVDAQPDRTWTKTLRTLSYFDALNLIDRIKCPVLFGIGLQDLTCSPVTIFAVYNKLSGEKDYRVYPDAGHWVDESHQSLRRKWFQQHFRGLQSHSQVE